MGTLTLAKRYSAENIQFCFQVMCFLILQVKLECLNKIDILIKPKQPTKNSKQCSIIVHTN